MPDFLRCYVSMESMFVREFEKLLHLVLIINLGQQVFQPRSENVTSKVTAWAEAGLKSLWFRENNAIYLQGGQ